MLTQAFGMILYVPFTGFSGRPLLFYRNFWPRFSPATEFMVPGMNVVSLGWQLSCQMPLPATTLKIRAVPKQIAFIISLQDIFLSSLRVVSCFIFSPHILHIATAAQWAFRGVILSKFMRCCCRGTPGNRWNGNGWIRIGSLKTAELSSITVSILAFHIMLKWLLPTDAATYHYISQIHSTFRW